MFKRRGKKWAELNARQRGAIRLLAIIQIGLLAAALVDIRGRTPAEINGRKRLWIAALFVNIIGPIAYFAFGRRSILAR